MPKHPLHGPCSVIGCGRIGNRTGMCQLHRTRTRRHGDPAITLQERTGRFQNNGYIMLRIEGKSKYEHVHLAEKALGKSLPLKAIVHHMNMIRSDNHTPFNLIICPDEEYHALLHKRMKEFAWLK